MIKEYLILIVPLGIVVLISLWLAFIAWRRRAAPGASSFMYLMLAIAWWTAGYIFEIIFIDINHKIFWAKFEYIGILTIPIAFLEFAIRNTRSNKYNNWRIHTLSGLLSLIFFVFIFSTENYPWLFADYNIEYLEDIPLLVINYGPLFKVMVATIYLRIIIAFLIMYNAFSTNNKLNRNQLLTLIVAAVVPFIANIIYFSGIFMEPLIDFTPFAFLISGIAIYMGFFKYHFLDISPIARNQLIENMVDGVLVLTPDDIIIDLNPSFRKILDIPNTDVIGSHILSIFENNPNIKRLLDKNNGTQKLILDFQINNKEANFEVKISPLIDDKNENIGRMIVFHDVTNELFIEKEIKETEERYQQLVEQSPITVGIHCDEKIVYINKAGLELFGAKHSDELIGKNIYSLMHPDYLELIQKRVQNTYINKESAEKLEEKMIRLDGSVIEVEVLNHPIDYQGKPASQVMIIDVSERRDNEKKRQRQLNELSVLHMVASLSSEAKDEDELIEKATKTIGEIVYPDNFGVLLVEDSNIVKEHHTYERKSEDEDILTFGLGEGVTGEVALTGKAINIPDVSQHENYIAINSMISSELCVPIKISKEVVGVVNAESNQLNAFSKDDERFLSTLADQLAIAIEKLRLFEEIQLQARTDFLTGISNRRNFIELATKEFERSKRYNNSLTAIMIDLDNFKEVNDSFGHAVGDIVLKAAAHKCKNQLREIDLFCRYGGEEFAILLPQTDLEKSEMIADRLLKEFNQNPIQIAEGSIHLTISIGVATMTSKIIHIDNLLNKADLALYEAKKKGKNSIGISEP